MYLEQMKGVWPEHLFSQLTSVREWYITFPLRGLLTLFLYREHATLKGRSPVHFHNMCSYRTNTDHSSLHTQPISPAL